MRFYNNEYQVEMDNDTTLADGEAIYFGGGSFQGLQSIQKVEAAKIPIRCKQWVGSSLVMVYYNPDNRKYTLMNEQIITPNREYGYALGGVTLGPLSPGGYCVSKLLAPYYGDPTCIDKRLTFDDSYSSAYEKYFETGVPVTIFDSGFDDGFTDGQDTPINTFSSGFSKGFQVTKQVVQIPEDECLTMSRVVTTL